MRYTRLRSLKDLPTEERIKRLKRHYSVNRVENLNWEVIQCHWRHGLTIQETAEVLGFDLEVIRFERDIAKQNAW